MGTEYAHMILNLALVMTLMFVLFYLVKKFRLTKYGKNKHINIINIVPIGAKEKVILMEVNKTILLLGATPNHIETLYVFNELDALKPETEGQVSKTPTFLEQMKGLR